jgi:hypothetical protein
MKRKKPCQHIRHYKSGKKRTVNKGVKKRIKKVEGVLKGPKSRRDALAFRVWVHPAKGGDDYFFEEDTFSDMKKKREKLLASPRYAYVEPILGVYEQKKR